MSKKAKYVAVQRFPEALVVKWLQLLRDRSLGELFESVLDPLSSAAQLKDVKKASPVQIHVVTSHTPVPKLDRPCVIGA